MSVFSRRIEKYCSWEACVSAPRITVSARVFCVSAVCSLGVPGFSKGRPFTAFH